MKRRYLVIVLIISIIVSIFLDLDYSNMSSLILISRLPRVISIIISGVGLCIAGLIMQNITRNKFTSPTTAGTMDFAKFGLVISMILMPNQKMMIKACFSFAFAFIGSWIFMYILKKLKVKNDIFVPLIGMIFGGIIASITSFITYALDMNQTVNAYFQGSFSTVIKGRYELLYICIPMIVLAFIYANKFTIAKMGQDFSKNLGLNYQGVVNLGLIVVSCISGLTLVMVGNIPFLGLIVPNIIVLIKGDNLKNILVDTCLFGATFILLCDIISRSIIRPYEISIGLTVGVIGSAIFLYLVLRRQDGK